MEVSATVRDPNVRNQPQQETTENRQRKIVKNMWATSKEINLKWDQNVLREMACSMSIMSSISTGKYFRNTFLFNKKD